MDNYMFEVVYLGRTRETSAAVHVIWQAQWRVKLEDSQEPR